MKHRELILAAVLIVGMAMVPLTYAEEVVAGTPATGGTEQRDIQRLELTSGKSRVLDLPVAINSYKSVFFAQTKQKLTNA